jgi:hypothetical protein
MRRARRHTSAWRNARTPWHPRACVWRPVTLRVDYATGDGRGWLGMVRNLSLQGMFLDSCGPKIIGAFSSPQMM